MKTTRTYTQSDIEALIYRDRRDNGETVTECQWDVSERRDAYDKPTGMHNIEVSVSVEEDK